jgi:RNA polymerase sigma-70 factor (ECF subfamily)
MDDMHLRLAVEPERYDGPTASEPHVDDGTRADQVDIAALIQSGRHREAIAACAGEHGVVLGRLCMALLGSQADADEAVQETLLRAHRGIASYRGEGSVKAWLCGIARHVCAYVLESRQRHRDALARMTEPDAQDVRDGQDGQVEQIEHVGRRARTVRRALEQLKPSEREALVLRYVADLSHREIGTALRLDEAAARKRISRAIAHLRAVMTDHEPERAPHEADQEIE